MNKELAQLSGICLGVGGGLLLARHLSETALLIVGGIMIATAIFIDSKL